MTKLPYNESRNCYYEFLNGNKKAKVKKSKKLKKASKKEAKNIFLEETANPLLYEAEHEEASIPSINSIEDEVLECIVGQDKQVRQIITAIYRTIEFENMKTNLLVIGNSGTGKTETVTQIAKRLNIPYTVEDATKYTKEGYYGEDVENMIYNLLDNANQNVERAQHGIIIIDEIDKKAGHADHDISGTDVLKSLLKIIEGTTIKMYNPEDPYSDEKINFNTKDIVIIFLGAFSGLEKIRDKRLNSTPLGFSSKTRESETTKPRYLKKDLVEYGMPEEFVGRIDTIIEMNKLNKENLVTILEASRLSIFRIYEAELEKKGIALDYNSKLFEAIAEESLALDTGARELKNTVNYVFENIMYDVISNPGKYSKCTLDLDIVHDNTKYTLT